VGHTCGHLAQGGHLAFKDHHFITLGFFPVARHQTFQHNVGGEHRAENNKTNSQQGKNPHQIFGAQQRSQGFPGVFFEDQHPFLVLMGVAAYRVDLSLRVVSSTTEAKSGPGGRSSSLPPKRGSVCNKSSRLIRYASPVGRFWRHRRYCQGHLNQWWRAKSSCGFFPDQYRNDKMRHLSETQKDVAHIQARTQERVKPFGVPVINLL
jgi:hypothetical protein